MLEEKETTSVTIRRITLDDVWFEGLGPLEIKAIASDIEARMDKISKDKNIFDSFKLFLHTALYYAAKSYSKNSVASVKTKDETKQLDAAIEKLSHCLNSLPLK
ncbi:MAG: hypothetical protein LBM71_05920 [Elusimicrobiota bacterium]|jgi:hypothetical protein|nr:hypothetical protein [Elusimicrobiota bacterium]